MSDIVEPLGDTPHLGRTGVLGALAGFLICVVTITVAGIAYGMESGSALGLGIFVGAWGGAGFGFMMGCTIPLARHMDRAQHSSRGR